MLEMPRHRRTKAKKLVVLSPIPELSGESRSPTPVNDTALTDVPLSKKEDVSMVGKDISESEDNRFPSPTVDAGDSFRDHLMTLNEEYQEEIMKLRRQLQKELELGAKLTQESRQYRLEYYNYRMSWDLDQTEIQRLKGQSLEEGKQQKDLEERMKRLEEEHEKLKQSYSKNVEENLSLKNIMSSMTSVDTERDQIGEKGEEIKVIVPPKMPRSTSKASRRPYIGKSREVHLPPITEHNKVVTSSKQTTKSSSSGNKLSSPNSLPSIPATTKSFLPTPPSFPRQTPSRRHSRIPLPSRTVQSASVGNVSPVSQEQH